MQQRLSLNDERSDVTRALQRAERLAKIHRITSEEDPAIQSDCIGRDCKLGDSSAIVPPVKIKDQAEVRKLGTVSTPGSWKNYYKGAEASMASSWATIFPMINGSDFTQVLEVAAGACRNTEKLLPLSGHISVTDIDPTAVDDCRKRFGKRPNDNAKLSYAVVDGVHLPVANESTTLIYQFDSGVHFNREVIHGYLKEFHRVLAPGGTGFFHHSNLAASEYPVIDDLDVTKNQAWRSNMTRSLFETYAKEVGLEMLCHPLVTWGGLKDLDAFARFRKPSSKPAPDSEKCPSHLDIGR
jgi:SAM-dependent methyltransferase